MKKYGVLLIAAVGLGWLAFAGPATAHPNAHLRLKLYNMSSSITDCGVCDHVRDGPGPLFTCSSCALTCNCQVGGFTADDGRTYDGKFYPGVVVK